MTKYIGIPFEDRGQSLSGADCYGLLRLIFKEDCQIDIPEFLASCHSSKAIFSDYLKQISEYWEPVSNFKKYDVVAMSHDPSHPSMVQHFGLYIGNGLMLHTLENIGSHIVELNTMNYYIKGVYRWKNQLN